MQGRLLLDVVVREGAAIFQLLSSKDQTLLIRRNAFLVLDLGLDIVNGVRGFHIQGDGLASESLDKDLHTTTETEDQVQGGFLLDVVITQCPSIFELLSGENQTLLIRGDSLLVLDLGLDVVDGVRRLNIERNGLS